MRWLVFIAFIIAAAFAYITFGPIQSLDEIQVSIEKKYPDIRQLDMEKLEASWSHNRDNVVFFDVREKGEFDVSHLQNAVQIDPAMSGAEFMEKYGTAVSGKDIVFYCSVGRRASKMATRVYDVNITAGIKNEDIRISNLKGGIFNWHNNTGPLSSVNGDTDLVHPFNKKWGQLITHPDKISYALTQNKPD
jgi:rhodanese-related sulfurtransferase